MRLALLVSAVSCLWACSGNSAGPSSVSSASTINIAGTWNGTMASSNNDTQQVVMMLTQTGSNITGTWDSTSVGWTGQATGALSGSSFSGQLTFSGTTISGTVCTGTATVSGAASASTMNWTSASGVVGASCPAPLPVGIKIDVQHQ